MDLIWYALIGVGTLIAVVWLRSATDKKVEITLNDAVIAAIAVVLALVIGGKISKFGIGPTGVTAETTREAILSSAEQPIVAQVTPLPVASVAEAAKGGVGDIPAMVRDRVQALDFTLGFGGYAPWAIQEYFNALTPYDFFRYVIILEPDGRLFGLTDARSLQGLLADPASPISFESFADDLNAGDDPARARIAGIPGFVAAEEGVTDGADKRQVLARMEETGRDWLPVIGASGGLEGIVERSRLTASLILDVTDRLSAAPPAE